MEIKKTPKADLENKKMLFKEIGLVISLILILLAFNWSSSEKEIAEIGDKEQTVIEEEQVPITDELPPPPPENNVVAPVVPEVIVITDDNTEIETEIFGGEDDKSIGITPTDYIPKQDEEEVVDEAPIPFALVEEKPTFMGKDQNEFTKWVYKNINYPDIAKENGIQGRVTLQFEIGADGKVRNVKVLRGVDAALDKEAIRVVSSSPAWNPGKNRGKPVKIKYTFPLVFQLK